MSTSESGFTPRTRRPVDASMDLLNQIMRNPYDPDYTAVAGRADKTSRGHWVLVLVAVLIGALFAVAALQTTRRAPILAGERTDLITRIRQGELAQNAQRQRAAALDTEISTLRTAITSRDKAAQVQQAAIERLEPIVAAVAVTGPGLKITVDDGAQGESNRSARVYDTDLQILANGLWQAGAEAVAINGHRLSALTAIRGAGEAVTVDYRSLARPYVVEAIGNSRTLEVRFVESSAGLWWNELAQNQGLGYDIALADRLDLAADGGLGLRYAKRAG